MVHAADLLAAELAVRAIGNFGVAIICLTFIVRLLMFPIAQKQFRSMAAMRVGAAQDEGAPGALQGRQAAHAAGDAEALQGGEDQPDAAGCLPILLQIPIFYALYKVLMLAVEMRHQPFALWIKDLSAPDPLTPVNLFGFCSTSRRRPSWRSACCRSCSASPCGCSSSSTRADGPGPEAGLRDHAVGADVRDGAVRGRPAALLGGVEHPHHRAAEVALQPLSGLKAPRRGANT
jgi:hypothetical protein